MKSLEKIQKIAKVLHILAKIAFVLSIIGLVGCVIASIFVAIYGNNPDVINYLASKGQTYNFYGVLCACVCGCLLSIAMLIIYYNVKHFYKKEREVGTPFDKLVVKSARKIGVLYILVSIITAMVMAIVIACFGLDTFNLSILSYVLVGIVYLIISCILEYGVAVQKGKKGKID